MSDIDTAKQLRLWARAADADARVDLAQQFAAAADTIDALREALEVSRFGHSAYGKELRQLTAEREKLMAENGRLRADLLEIALAVGIAHEPEQGPCAAGPTDVIVRTIKETQRAAVERDELRARVERLEAAVEEHAEAIEADGAYATARKWRAALKGE